MNNALTTAKLIKKYKTIPNILKALGLDPASFREKANNKQWTTISLEGTVDGCKVNVSFHIKITKDNQLEFNGPRLIVTEKPVSYYQQEILEAHVELLNERMGIYK